MITKIRFEQIYQEVAVAVTELFDYAQHENDNFILFLAEAEFRPEYSASRFSPYVISDRIDHYKEASRLDFLEHFLNINYSFATAKHTTDNSSKMVVELMIYSHVWESTKFLKQLYRMKELVLGRSYPWEISEAPDSSKHNFIRIEIRDKFKEKGLKVAEIIKKGFHPSLRNSFLHGEFEIDKNTFEITLHTYRMPRNLKAYELSSISANAWSEYFLFTVCFNYLFIVEKEKRKMSIEKDFGRNEFLVVHPKKRSSMATRYSFGVRKIYYDNSRNSFSFYKSNTSYSHQKTPGKQKPLKTPPPKLSVSKRQMSKYEHYINGAVTQVLDRMEKASPVEYAAFLYDITRIGGGIPMAPASPPETGRMSFSGHFLFGAYINRALRIPDTIRTQLEMLIYCHIWESKVF